MRTSGSSRSTNRGSGCVAEMLGLMLLIVHALNTFEMWQVILFKDASVVSPQWLAISDAFGEGCVFAQVHFSKCPALAERFGVPREDLPKIVALLPLGEEGGPSVAGDNFRTVHFDSDNFSFLVVRSFVTPHAPALRRAPPRPAPPPTSPRQCPRVF
jgi:hypothetical protein